MTTAEGKEELDEYLGMVGRVDTPEKLRSVLAEFGEVEVDGHR